jgi:serine/threonine protein kinase
MAPEVLANPATDLTEGLDMTMPRLAAKNVRPYTEKVDVWAVGILCYELIVGRPPFEVENEQYTMNLIMNSNKINFPSQFSKDWASFVTLVRRLSPVLAVPVSATKVCRFIF